MSICRNCKTTCTCTFASGDGTTVAGTGSGASPITYTLNTGVWPYACANTNGSPIYIGEDGNIVSVPAHTCISGYVTKALQQVVPTQTVNITTYTEQILSMRVANPSDCRSMNVLVNYGTTANHNVPNGGGGVSYMIRPEVQVNGGGFAVMNNAYILHGNNIGVANWQHNVYRSAVYTLSPADAVQVDMRVGILWHFGTSSSPAAFNLAISMRIMSLGVTI